MNNPLAATYSEQTNVELVQASLAGDKDALETLVRIHQPFIYNVAWKMAHDPIDAQDLTQEVLIKVITKLSQFSFNSSFRTWLYRIVVNEFLQTKRRKSEDRFTSFEKYAEQLDAVPNPDLTKEEELEFEELSREMQVRCMSGMLMCLDREQRLIYILGDTFGLDHKLGGELFSISPQNFRVKLHRSRKDLYQYMNNKCGLVNKNNPCRCPKKAKALKKMGALTEDNMIFTKEFRATISEFVEEQHPILKNSIDETYTELYRDHPAKRDFSKETIVSEILDNESIMKYLT